jgi:GMP synthase (glutamine-hydrolysing)
LGSSDDVPVSVVAVGDHLVGFQGHPEFVPAYSAVLMEARRGVFIPDHVVDAGISSLSAMTDTRLLSDWITRFITG